MAARVGLVGLGLMGSAMTHNLLAAGREVLGFDLDESRRDEHVSAGGVAATSIAEVAAGAEVVVLSLPNSDISRSVCLGEHGIAGQAQRPRLVIDTTTGRPDDAVEIGGRLGEVGVAFVDATMSGNAGQARKRDIVAMAGGTAEAFAEARDVLEIVARSVHHLGPVGAGTTTKLIVNLILGVQRMVLAEGLVLGEKAGLDLERLLEVLKDGAAYSKAMDIWGRRMVEGDHLPPASRIRQSRKDFGLIVEQAQRVDAPAFLSSTVSQLLGTAARTGLAEADNSAVIALLRGFAGVPTRMESGDGAPAGGEPTG